MIYKTNSFMCYIYAFETFVVFGY